MGKKLYVGNLPFNFSESDIETLFAPHGSLTSAQVIMDRETGRSKGFAFVEMDNAAADAAIQALNGHEVNGRALTVNEARPRAPRTGGGGGGGGGGYGGGGGGGRRY